MAVGSNEEILALGDYDAQLIDLAGRTLMPGFIDAHNHLTHQGAAFNSVDFGYPTVSSVEDLRAAIAQAAQKTVAPASGFAGWGLNYEKFPGATQPTRWDIDDLCPDNPVCIVHISGHNILVNSPALELAGVDENTPDPDGGVLVRREDGQLTGLRLRQRPANADSH